MSLIHCTEYRGWRLLPSLSLSLFATRNYPVATLQLPCNFTLSSSLTCSSLVPHRQQVWNRREPSVGVTEGGLMNPTISGSYEAGRWNSKTWVSRFLSFVSVLRRKPAEDEHRSSLLPPSFIPLFCLSILFFLYRVILTAWTPLIEDLCLADLRTSFVRTSIARKFSWLVVAINGAILK